MVELKIYEVVPELNTRGQMGRVVISPDAVSQNLPPRETGKFYLCCKRAFLSIESFETHRRINNCKRGVESGNQSIISLKETIREVCSANQKVKFDNDGTYSSIAVGKDVAATASTKKSKNGLNGETTFNCQKCHYSCSSSQTFALHVETCHSEDLKQSMQILQGTHRENPIDIGKQQHPHPRLYKCDLCEVFTSAYKCNVDQHKRRAHVEDGEYPCPYCTCRYGTQIGITLHLSKVHNHGSRNGLNADFKKDSIKKEDAYSDEKITACDISGKSISRADWVQKTAKVYEQKCCTRELAISITIFKCGYCPKVFSQKFLLTLHQSQDHPHVNLHKADELQGVKCISTSTAGYQENTINCSKLKHSVPVSSREEHLPVSAHEDYEDSPNDLSSPFKLFEMSNSSGKIKYYDNKCHLCGVLAKNSSELSTHLKVAHVVFGVECECGCSFATATELTNHKNSECVKNGATVMSKIGPERIKQETHAYNCGSSCKSPRKLRKLLDLTLNECKSVPSSEIGLTKFDESIESRESVEDCKHPYTEAVQKNSENRKTLQPAEESDISRVKCPWCDNWFKNNHGLRLHLHSMHSGALYGVCEICQYRTRNFRSYKLHKKACHVVDGIKCPNCSYSLKSIEGLSSHFKKTHKCQLNRAKVELKCGQCDFIAFKSTDLEKHIQMEHNSESSKTNDKKIFSCKLCSFTTTLENQLERHFKLNHVENGVMCKVCNNSFNSEKGLRVHVFKMHGTDDFLTCELCNYHTGTRKNYKEHYQRCHVGPVKCPECVCSFKDVDGMSKHMNILHKKTVDRTLYLLKCSFADCKYTTYDGVNLKNHERTHSTRISGSVANGSKLLTCHICGWKTKTGSLEDHLSRAHVKDGYVCPEDCKCSFRTELGLIRHIRGRHGKKMEPKKEARDPLLHPVKCSECDFRSKDEHSLNKHCSRMHGFSIEIPKVKYRVCDLCHARTTGTMKDHKRRYHVPNGFKCLRAGCSCSFETYNSRSRHMIKAHQIIARKRCPVCKYKFVGSIQSHFKTCHVENGLKCEYEGCCCSFESEQGKLIHMRKQHGYDQTIKTCHLCKCSVTGTISTHIAKCHVENGLKCEYPGCCCSFESDCGRQVHMRRRHNVTEPKTCHICGYSIHKKLSEHIAKCHVENGLECKYPGCCCSFESDFGRQVHMRIRHNITEPKTCHICGYFIHTKLSKHIAKCHVMNGLPCSFCCCSFESELGRSMHMKIRHNIRVSANCTICGIKPAISMNAHLQQSHVVGGLPCSHCECAFKTERIRSRHLLRYHNISTNPTPKICPFCKMVIRIKMAEHFRNHHAPNGFRCSYCSWSFRNEHGRTVHTLKQHKQQTINNPPKIFALKRKICRIEDLSKSVKRQMDLNRPSISFTNLKFNTSLARSWNILRLHQKAQKNSSSKAMKKGSDSRDDQNLGSTRTPSSSSINHTSIKEDFSAAKLYQCEYCSCQFSSEEGKNSHCKLIHSTYENPMTELQNENITSAEMDNKIGESQPLLNESLTCSKCGYVAKLKSHLNMHAQKSHVENSSFACNFCSCSYGSDKELRRHKKVFHSKKPPCSM